MKDPKQHSKSGGLSYCGMLISTVAGCIGVQQCSGSCMHLYIYMGISLAVTNCNFNLGKLYLEHSNPSVGHLCCKTVCHVSLP